MPGNRLLWYHASRWQVEGHQDIATQSPHRVREWLWLIDLVWVDRLKSGFEVPIL